VNPRVPLTLQDDIEKAEAAARHLGLKIIVLKAASEDDIERAFAIAAQQADAVQLGTDAFFDSRREQIAEVGRRYAISTMALTRRAVAAGSLISYGSDQVDGIGRPEYMLAESLRVKSQPTCRYCSRASSSL
jgi:ABC-type uncharacterized transport system substrate-binding protein